jgi:hypothetical protein
MTTPARLANSDRSDPPFRPAYFDYGYDLGYDHISKTGKTQRAREAGLNIQTRLYDFDFGYDHTSLNECD